MDTQMTHITDEQLAEWANLALSMLCSNKSTPRDMEIEILKNQLAIITELRALRKVREAAITLRKYSRECADAMDEYCEAEPIFDAAIAAYDALGKE